MACERKVFLGNRYTVSNSIGIVGLSCFYAINMSMDEMMFHVMKVAIQTWIFQYNGAIFLDNSMNTYFVAIVIIAILRNWSIRYFRYN